MRLNAVEEGRHLLSSHELLAVCVTCEVCPWSSIIREVIRPEKPDGDRKRGWAGGRKTKDPESLALIWSSGEREGGMENPAPGEVDGKDLGGRSVILVPSRKTKTPVQWITAILQVAGRKSP